MSGAAVSGGVAGQRAAGAAEAVVECDGGGQRGEAAGEADAQLVQDARAVAFEAEDVFGGEEDRFDALADRREVRSVPGLVGAARAVDGGVEHGEVGFELAPAEVLVADDDQHLADLTLSARPALGRRSSRRSSATSGHVRGGCRPANRACNLKPQKKRLW